MTEPARYRKRPVVIEAIQYRPGPGGNCNAVAAFVGDDDLGEHGCDPDDTYAIGTLEGVMEAQPGDWIVRGVQGEFYPVKPDIFAATYGAGMSEELAPRCGRCRKRHLLDLPCWWGKYAQAIVAGTLTTQGTVCWLCGKAGADSADHVTPRSHGGTDTPDNLRPAHNTPCNARRRAGAPFDPDPEPRPTGVGLSPRWRTT